MSRTVLCRKYQEELEGLDRAPYPGPKGQDIYDNISKKAWKEWTDHQTMIINEKHLSLMDPSTREFLQTEMEKFMTGGDYEKAEGYVPPSK
ncbi:MULTISPECIES: oxidative damage protection protein [unclassified Neptuniibacter]|jgi:Fe-S cluster biosynthesis and repair protein YggX|uniref:oxidative damage protection protein n=1 Tax=unclassified Neptuniibacter TaxID=2630693 RepID=UPI000C602729|nr:MULTISPECIES: oxidative damage protection protein [unclassified Neptuniibacter]MAY41862.1 oxidative damage protection protein [Oceanospirillaceae bacterium]|tara:strand:+ start:20603 stop:20875 length:273 start_codon:yes stop_codon:yes gene_type:complete